MATSRIIWSKQAKQSLKDIYAYFKKKSPQGAKNLKDDLLLAPRTILFSKQYQVDDINPKYRRIVVRDFKILYTQSKKEIQILDIVSTRQSPDVLKSM